MKEGKFIFITGGVLSSLGKGLAAASLGALLKARGLNVTIQKLDPYINVDPGTMNPTQHGEIFVTDDGAETDMDLGHYERYLDVSMAQQNNYTSGSIYYSVIRKERQGDYHGGTVQVIPHITDEIKQVICNLTSSSQKPDVVIVEIGGTVGDIESQPFLEAIRQLRGDLGKDRCLFIHLTLVPYLACAGEHKTKPTQHSVKELRSIGISPDIILCRCEQPVPSELKRKIALFCDVDVDAVFSAVDVDHVYKVPLEFYQEGLDQKVAIMLRLPAKNPDLELWHTLLHTLTHPQRSIQIGIVGKYVELKEAYKSLHEALIHGGIANHVQIVPCYVNSEEITSANAASRLGYLNGILVPGGFGERGVDGKIAAVQYARTHQLPFLGICLGMQCAVIEFARNVAGFSQANSQEFNPACEEMVIHLPSNSGMLEQVTNENQNCFSAKHGSMRLGSYPCTLLENTKAHDAYQVKHIHERHRHRYEFNPAYIASLEKVGMVFSGFSPHGDLVELIELADHPWFVGCQFHPEFKSRPMNPHPLFKEFIRAAKSNAEREKT